MPNNPAQTQTQLSYDNLPYIFESHALTHPDRLATVGTLFGMTPVPIENCRVLELGCASGGNLLPMAYSLPQSQFTGIDLSQVQVEKGQEMTGYLKLKNVSLICKNLMDFDESLGQFDYIIAHGIFSWVPPEVQHKMLDICMRSLSPQGIAYISYNVLPGWNLRQDLRHFLLYHTRKEDQIQPRLRTAIDGLEFIAKQAVSTPEKSYLGYLVETINSMKDWTDSESDLQYWYHEYLEEFNQPLHIHEVAEMAAQYHLQYMSEADDTMMYYPIDFAPEVNEFIHAHAHTLVEREQYLDYLNNRMFRRSLFCHEEVKLLEKPGTEQISRLYANFSLAPTEKSASLSDETPIHFKVKDGVEISSTDPLEKAILVYLHEQHPRFVPFEDLAQAVRSRLPERGADIAREKIANVLYINHVRSSKILEFSTWLPELSSFVSERPEASLVARLQASLGGIITNLRHDSIRMSEQTRYLVWCLNGSRDHAEILNLLETSVKEGKIHFINPNDDNNLDNLRDELEKDLERQLGRFSNIYLLIR